MLHGAEIRVGWGKAVAIPAVPCWPPAVRNDGDDLRSSTAIPLSGQTIPGHVMFTGGRANVHVPERTVLQQQPPLHAPSSSGPPPVEVQARAWASSGGGRASSA